MFKNAFASIVSNKLAVAAALVALEHIRDNPAKAAGQLSAGDVAGPEYTLDYSGWEHFSGNQAYPVPSQNKAMNEVQAYKTCENIWTKRSAYGRMNWALVDWLIAQAQEALKVPGAVVIPMAKPRTCLTVNYFHKGAFKRRHKARARG